MTPDPLDRPGRRPRVVFVGHSAELSGAELYLSGMLHHARTIDPVVVLLEDGPLRERLEADGVEVRTCDMPARLGAVTAGSEAPWRAVAAMPSFARRLRRALRETRADAVYTNSAKAHVIAVPLARTLGLPSLVHVHERLARDTYGRGNLAALRGAVRAADAVITNSRATRDSLPPRVRDRAEVHYCPVALAEPGSLPGMRPAEEARAAGADVLSIALVGRITEWKGQHLAIEALGRLRAHAPQAELDLHLYGGEHFSGDSDHAERCRSLVNERGLAGHVHWHGHVDDVATAMGRHDVLIHTSTRPEPFGQVVVEAMAAGLPVVAVDAGGPREVISHGFDGLLYPLGDVGALAAALDRLRRDPVLRARLALAGADRARSFSYELLVPAWEARLAATARTDAGR